MNLNALKKAGFTDSEIKVYLSLLELGESSTGPIITKSKITGSKVYEVLEKLIKKGLVGYVTKEKIKHFQAASPNRILDYIEKTEKEIKDNKEEIKSMLPELEDKQQSSKLSQTAQVFEGLEGLKTVFKLILEETKNGGEYYAFAVGDEMANEDVITFLKNHHLNRIENKGKVKLILRTQDMESLPGWEKLEGLEMKFYDHELPVGLFIFGDYIANITFSHKTAFLIKSQYVANSYKKFFEATWEKAKT